jgi:hypothetical protein
MGLTMHTKRYMDSMKKCKECLSSMKEYEILAKALEILSEEADFFEKYIGKESPDCDNRFKKHFKEFLNVPFETIETDECLSVYEDVAMLFREKQLRLGHASLSEDEVNILNDFEKRITDKTCLAYQWYYEKLPLKIVLEVSEVMVHKY